MSSDKEVLTYVAKRYGYSAGLALLRAKAREQAKEQLDELSATRAARRELVAKLINEPTVEVAEQVKETLGHEAELRAAIKEKTAETRTAMKPIRAAVKFYDNIIATELTTAGYDVAPKTELDAVDEKLIEMLKARRKAEVKA